LSIDYQKSPTLARFNAFVYNVFVTMKEEGCRLAQENRRLMQAGAVPARSTF
jgi:hypothetical protein